METVGIRYAEALFELGVELSTLDDFKTSLNSINENIIDESDFLKILTHPKISRAEKKEIIQNIYSNKVKAEIMNFLMILVDKGRIKYIKDINKHFNQMYNKHNNIVEAKVYSAVELKDSQVSNIKETLEKQLEKVVEIHTMTDDTVVGGVRIVVEDQVFDNTIQLKLDKLRANLIETKL